jgi:hypothetical protein
MRSLSKMINVLALIIMISACATTKPQIPEKYALDNQLEPVKEVQYDRLGFGRRPAFTDFNVQGEDPVTVMLRRDTVTLSESQHHWIKVDQQSLIIRTSPSEYYLMVLHRPSASLLFVDNISIISPTNVIRAGLDLIQMQGDINYIIERIYKIDSHEKVFAIRDQLKGSS